MPITPHGYTHTRTYTRTRARTPIDQLARISLPQGPTPSPAGMYAQQESQSSGSSPVKLAGREQAEHVMATVVETLYQSKSTVQDFEGVFDELYDGNAVFQVLNVCPARPARPAGPRTHTHKNTPTPAHPLFPFTRISALAFLLVISTVPSPLCFSWCSKDCCPFSQKKKIRTDHTYASFWLLLPSCTLRSPQYIHV